MQRNTIKKDKRVGFDSLLTDQQSLLFKLCDQLLISGFVFEDATANETEAGGDVIKNFFYQENNTGMMRLVHVFIQFFLDGVKGGEFLLS